MLYLEPDLGLLDPEAGMEWLGRAAAEGHLEAVYQYGKLVAKVQACELAHARDAREYAHAMYCVLRALVVVLIRRAVK